MPQPLSVDPMDLILSSDHLAMHHAEHIEVHGAANARIESASSGWVGASATALMGKISQLQRITSHISGELEHHRDALRLSGQAYNDADAGSAADIDTGIRDGNHAR